MTEPNVEPDKSDAGQQEAGTDETPLSGQVKSTMSKSMHDGVEVWCDCCSCEAEPYWVEAMKDYEIQT